MKRFSSYRVTLFFLVIVLVASLQPFFAVAQTCEEPIGKMVSVQGTVESQKAGGTQWQPVKLNDTLCPGDTIRVLDNSRAQLALANQSVLRINENTTITLEGVDEDQTSLIDLLKGAALFFSRGTRKLKVKTQYAIFGVRGTEFFIRVEERQALMSVFEGAVLAENKVGSLTLKDGQSTIAAAGKAPVLTVVARLRDAVQWALYYLPVIYVPPGETPIEDISDPRFLAYRASQLLAVGRVDEAGADIERALSLDLKYSDAFALQSIIAVVQNEKDKALNSAQKAVEAGPNSATARIAMSYAQQADFDIEGALKSLQEAVKLGPDDALAWARLAELWSSFGRLGKALDAANKAVKLDPSLSRTQMVLGFAYLTQVKTTASKAAFEKAIEFDQAEPLSRLGLGLAKIREGDLKAGVREIEIAASLDPNNSLVRSYLGKAYYEEKRTELDGEQFKIAKELDPRDPTPWLYDAIRLQSINRPVEALVNIQKSIELNNNRAVYRSKLLLDDDLAARGARLGSIYRDLGFEQLALVEGWKSTNIDPSNHSAHRLLADLYSVLPRHEIARDSELLQSQLLQPININPVRPRLADNGLAFLDDTAPGDVGFNEYSRLFVANRAQLLADVIGGGNNTFADNLILSGIYQNLSYSAGQFHLETDGFHENNDLNQNIYNGFVQGNLSHRTSLQAEFRVNDEELGDRRLLFFPDNFSSTESREIDKKSARVGLRHSFAPNSTFIASYIYSDEDIDFEDMGLNISVDENIHFIEFRHLYQWGELNFTGGFGHFSGDLKEVATNDSFTLLDEKSDIRHTNAYVYTNINYPRNLILTLGASFDSVDEVIADRDQVNPKFGLAWNIYGGTTLRAAVFRTVKRTVSSSQTLEPTQIAGFNQFFDDLNATDAWRWGIALDQQFTPHLSAGAEFSRRDLKTPARSIEDLDQVEDQDETEDLVRGYLFWTPWDRLALGVEYLYEKFNRDPLNTQSEAFVESKTHRVPLEARFFHPSGFFSRAQATFVYQDGLFRNAAQEVVSGSDDFWVVDLSLGFRLPKRYGIITLGVRNLFDKSFNFQDSGEADPGIISPERLILGRVTLSF